MILLVILLALLLVTIGVAPSFVHDFARKFWLCGHNCHFWVRRSRVFSIGSVRHPRIDERSYPTQKGVGTIRRIAFEIGDKSVVTRGNLSLSEAQELLALLAPYFAPETVPVRDRHQAG